MGRRLDGLLEDRDNLEVLSSITAWSASSRAAIGAGLLGLWLAAVGPPQLGAQTRGMRFERLSVEEGLSQGTVNEILQDSGGFLWIATQDGLNRYDGYRFEVYQHDPEDPASLPGSWILALAEDAAGDLWIGTEGGGLARWRRSADAFVRFRHDPEDPASLSGDRVMSILIDRQGQVWLGTAESGLNRLDPESGRFERFRHDPAEAGSLSDDYVQTLYEDRSGNLWAGTWGGLDRLAPDRFDASTRTFAHYRHDPAEPNSLSDDRILSILEDHLGRLWVGTMDGLHRWDPEVEGFIRYVHDPADPESLSQDRVRTLFEDRSQRLWVATDGGLNLLLDASGRFARYRHDTADPSSLSNDRVTSIFQDSGGVLWIGTQGGGANKWNPATWAFSHFKADPAAEEGLSNPAVYGFSEDAEGKIWIATHGGVNVLDRTAGSFRHFRHDPGDPESLSDDRVAALLHDRQGTLWVATLAGGLNRLDAGARGFERYRHDPGRPDSLAKDAVASLFEDRQGTLWVGTWGGGLDRFEGASGSAFAHYRHDPEDPASLSADRVTAFAEAGADLWIGTFGGGLNRMDPSGGSFGRLRHDAERSTSLSNDTVYALHAGDSGALWAGTQEGLNRLERLDGAEAVFRRYLARDGLPNDSVWGIRSDGSGRLWISTNGGLSRLDPGTETFVNFDVSHGLQSNEFNWGAHYASRTGELFFGGTNGFNAFFPDRIGSNPHAPPVVLTRLTRFNQPLVFDRPLFDVEDIALSYRDHLLAFEFAALDFTAPERNRYRYRLEGFDDTWVELGVERRVTFTSIEPGDYTLRVQGSNNDGEWNQEGLALALSVAPPFWRTWWFQSLAALFVASAVFAGYRIRTRAIRNRNILLEALVKERTRELEEAQEQLVRKEKLATLGELAGSLAHEIRNPLGVIKNATYLLNVLRPPDDEDLKEQLDQIDQEVEYSNNIIGELLDFAREPAAGRRKFTLQQAAEQALDAVEVPAAVELEHRLDGEPLLVHADPAQVRSILVNLLQNAVQAVSGHGTVRLECHRARSGESDIAFVSVIDTGAGIAADQLEKIFEPLFTTKARGIGLGLSLSQRYAGLNGGRIECDSEPGQGSIFRLVLPLLTDRSSPSG